MVQSFADRPGRAALPFLVVAAAGMVSMLFPPFTDQSYDGWAAGAGLVVTLVLVSLVTVIPRDHWAAAVPPLLFFLVVAVLRDATGGASSELTPLILLPVLWIVLYGTPRQLQLAAVAAGSVFVVPMLLVGPPEYDPQDWRRALVWVLSIVIICPTLQRGVLRLRESIAAEKRMAGELASVLRAATDHAIIATDLTGTITVFSQGAERMLGYSAADLVGSASLLMIHDRDEIAAAARGAAAGIGTITAGVPADGSTTRRWTYRRHDGSALPVSVTTTELLDDDSVQVGWIGVARDVTVEEAALHDLRRAEARWRIMLEHLPDISVLLVGTDLRYRVAAGAGLLRQGWTDLTGRSVDETSSAVNAAILAPLYRRALNGETASGELMSTNTGAVTQIITVPLPGTDRDDPEALILARDVTADRQREAELTAARDHAHRLFDEAPHGALLLDATGTVTQINPALTEMTDVAAGAVLDRPLLTGPLGGLLDAAELSDLTGGASLRVVATRALHIASPTLTTVEVAAVSLPHPDGGPRSVLVSVVDVSERKRFEKQLAHLADHDPLTGLANRRKFDAELAAHLDRCRRYGAQGALLMLDLDNFKQINDTLGHGAGDQLIVSVASVLRERLRASDVVARLGGDEFAILLPVADRAATTAVAQDIVELIRTTVCVLADTQPRSVTTSLGAVLIQDVDATAGELLSTADMTMYDAKEAGRDQYVIHDLTEYAIPRTGARMAWTGRIADALTSGAFRIHAQPILDIASGRVTGAELLIRMVDDAGDLVMPGEFLPIAERTSLITDIDAYMLEQAADIMSRVAAVDPDFSISVNLSGRSVGNPRITSLIPRLINQYRFNPANLILEITETAAVATIETARVFAEQLRALGCRFALDDFGAGFGSFFYLKHLVFDYVKIDGEFVSHAPGNPADRLIIASIVDLARGMGKTTIAEFVADADILDTVTALGVDHAQGYHIGRPVPVDELITQLQPIRP